MSIAARLGSKLYKIQAEADAKPKMDDADSPMQILRDAESYKMAQKLYQSYISESDFSRFHGFMINLDRLMVKYGAKPDSGEAEEMPDVKEDKEIDIGM